MISSYASAHETSSSCRGQAKPSRRALILGGEQAEGANRRPAMQAAARDRQPHFIDSQENVFPCAVLS